VDRYKRKEVELVIPCRVRSNDGSEPDHYHLIASAVPFMGIGHIERPTESFNGSASSPHDGLHGRNEFVFIPVTQFVQCPQEVIASSVRLEPAKQRLNLFREVSGTPDRASHVVNVTGERKSAVSSVRLSDCVGDGVTGIVQNASQVNDNVAGNVAKCLWKGLDKFYLVNLPARSLRIGFDDLCVWIEVVKLPDSPVEIGEEVFLSPCEFAT
jgi:hypothetical protein